MADDRPADEPTPPPTGRRPAARARLDRRTVVLCVAVAAVAALVSIVVTYNLFGSDGDSPSLSRASFVPDTKFAKPDGSTASLVDYRGQKLVVNFFASTCAPCRTEMATLEQVQRDAGDEITVLGIAVRDDPAAAAALVKRSRVSYDTGLDDSGALFDGAGGTLLPFTIFVAADGTIMERRAGALTAATLRERISANLLAGG